MASRYLREKARRELSGTKEETRPLTRREKILNWFYYARFPILAGAVLLGVFGSILWNALGIGRTRPDEIAAYIGASELSEEDAAALAETLSALAGDVNGDGKCLVELRQYVMDRSGDEETALYFNYAAQTRLAADLSACESGFFLVEDPEGMQRTYQLFADPDGTPPAEEDHSAEGKVRRAADCTALSGLLSEHAALSGLSVGRRAYYDEKQAARHKGADILWEKIAGEAAG